MKLRPESFCNAWSNCGRFYFLAPHRFGLLALCLGFCGYGLVFAADVGEVGATAKLPNQKPTMPIGAAHPQSHLIDSRLTNSLHFFVDPHTDSDNPEQRMAYGLNVTPPWADGGCVFINFPEHLEYMPGTRGIARHHDARRNVWQVSPEGSEAGYAVESLSEPGVFFSVRARAENDR